MTIGAGRTLRWYFERLGVAAREVVVDALLDVAQGGLPGVVEVLARGELGDSVELAAVDAVVEHAPSRAASPWTSTENGTCVPATTLESSGSSPGLMFTSRVLVGRTTSARKARLAESRMHLGVIEA